MTVAADSPVPQTRPGFDREIVRLITVVMLGAIMVLLDTMIVNLSVPALAKHFGSPLTTIQWVLAGYMLAGSVALPVTSWAVERFGGRNVWLFSLSVFLGGAVLSSLSWSITALIVFRVLQGFGGGMMVPTGQAMLARAAGPHRMGRVMGVFTMLAMLAMITGPLLGGLISDNLSWRFTFLIHLPLCVTALVTSIFVFPRTDERSKKGKLDVLGLLLLPPGVAALVYGLSKTGQGVSLASPDFLVPAGAGVVLIALFVAHSLRRREAALIDVRLLSHRPFAASVTGFFLYAGGVFGVMVLLPLYAQLVRGETGLLAGLLLAPLGVGAMITMPIAGRLVDRYGPRRVAPAGILVMILGALTYTQVDATTSIALLMGTVVVVGLGHGMVIPSLITGSYQGLPPKSVPAATTSANILSQFGGSAGVTALFVVLQLAIQAEIPGSTGTLAEAAKLRGPDTVAQLADAFAHSFWWSIGLAAAALIPILYIPKPATEEA